MAFLLPHAEADLLRETMEERLWRTAVSRQRGMVSVGTLWCYQAAEGKQVL